MISDASINRNLLANLRGCCEVYSCTALFLMDYFVVSGRTRVRQQKQLLQLEKGLADFSLFCLIDCLIHSLILSFLSGTASSSTQAKPSSETMNTIAILFSLLWAMNGCQGFSAAAPRRHRTPSNTRTALTPHDFLIATIDSDIANMSENEFAPVFMGGIAVMFGGLLSAIFVGIIVDRKDLSAQIVAESYSQGQDDEEFWKGLSAEEKTKAQEILRRVRESKGEKQVPALTMEATPVEPTKTPSPADKPPAKQGGAVDMFDDYSG